MTKSVLFIVATPIGNLQDITLRALEVLEQVDVIAAEDTRHSASLMSHFSISTPMIAVHEHNEINAANGIIGRLSVGESVALICDAGTPLISDPGYHLVNQVRNAGYEVVPVVGACALIAALSVCGLATDHFTFMGFLPAKAGARQQILTTIKDDRYTHIFYESPHRILASVTDMLVVLGADRHVSIARELTKTYETIKSGNLAEVLQWMQQDPQQQRGEFVVLIEGASKTHDQNAEIDQDTQTLIKLLLLELPIRTVASVLAKARPYTKKQLYNCALEVGKHQ